MRDRDGSDHYYQVLEIDSQDESGDSYLTFKISPHREQLLVWLVIENKSKEE
jgi:hypothetical protein